MPEQTAPKPIGTAELAEIRAAYTEWLSESALLGPHGSKAISAVPRLVADVERHRAEIEAYEQLLTQPEATGDEPLAIVARVIRLHSRSDDGTCRYCSYNDYPNYSVPWPCVTVRALLGQEPPRE